jgi:hypothetical protein
LAFFFWSLVLFMLVFVSSQINKEFNIGGISQFVMSSLRKRHHLNVDVRKWGLVFAKCTIVCESFKDLISKLEKHNNDAIEYEMKLKKHISHQESRRKLYHVKDKVCSIKGGIPMHYPWQNWLIMRKLLFQGYKCATKWYLGLDNSLLIWWVSPIDMGMGNMFNIWKSCGQMIPISQLDLCCGFFAF